MKRKKKKVEEHWDIEDSQIGALGKQLVDLGKRFDEHVQIYAENGKESKRLADTVEGFGEMMVDRNKKIDEMWEAFAKARTGRDIFIGFFKFFALIGAGVGGIYAAIHYGGTVIQDFTGR